MELSKLAAARSYGAQGIALIRGIWNAPEPERLLRQYVDR
jgi:thiamine monophosphate synthase